MTEPAARRGSLEARADVSRAHPGDEAGWALVRQSLGKPYRVTASMVLLVSLVPLYIFIGAETPGRVVHAPEIALDRLVPLRPVWTLVYGSLYLFVILLPIFLVREEALLRSTVRAYLAVWITAYVFFLAYPTVAPRPPDPTGDGFAAWGLRFLYGADPPYNCFPSLHVAHSFVSALACYRVHRGVGVVAVVSASLIGISTLFTKQHYVADVIAGAALASLADLAFLRRHRREALPALDVRVAPLLAGILLGSCAVLLVVLRVVFELVRARLGPLA